MIGESEGDCLTRLAKISGVRHFPLFLSPSSPFPLFPHREINLQIQLRDLGSAISSLSQGERHFAATSHVPWALNTPKIRLQPGLGTKFGMTPYLESRPQFAYLTSNFQRCKTRCRDLAVEKRKNPPPTKKLTSPVTTHVRMRGEQKPLIGL